MTQSRNARITQKCRSLTFHIHKNNSTGTVTPTDHASWRPPSGHRGMPKSRAQSTGATVRGEHVPAGGKYSESLRRCQGRGRGPAENVRCCTIALAPNLLMLRPRTMAAPVQWPSPCRCPHRVHHAPIALQPTHGRPMTRKDCSRDALCECLSAYKHSNEHAAGCG